MTSIKIGSNCCVCRHGSIFCVPLNSRKPRMCGAFIVFSQYCLWRKGGLHSSSRSIDYSAVLFRMMGICFAFLPTITRFRANTISDVRSKKPIFLFQLIPHLQCCKPGNCCFIFLPQLGQTLLLMPISLDLPEIFQP